MNFSSTPRFAKRLVLFLGVLSIAVFSTVAYAYTEFELEYPEGAQAHHEFRYINDSQETENFLQYSRVWKLQIDLENDFWNNTTRNSYLCKIQYADADGETVQLRYAEFPGCDYTRRNFAGGTTVNLNNAEHRIDITFGTEDAYGRPLISGINTSRGSGLTNEEWRMVWFAIDFSSKDVDEQSWTATSVGKAYIKNLKYKKPDGPWGDVDDYHWITSDRVRTAWGREAPTPPPPNVFIQKRVRNITRGEETFRSETRAQDEDELEYRISVTNASQENAAVNIDDNLLCTLRGQRNGDNNGHVTRNAGFFERLSACSYNHDVIIGEPYIFTYRATASAEDIPPGETSAVVNTATIEDASPEDTEGVGRNDDARVIIENPSEIVVCETLMAEPEEIPENTEATITVTVTPRTFDGDIRYATAAGTFTANAPAETGNPLETRDHTVTYSGGPEGTITITTVGPGASAACADTIRIRGEEIEPYCGDGNIDAGEACDDGNNVNGDGCNADCEIEEEEIEPYCGDGNLDPGEACDDGNNVNGDGCNADCTLPGGGTPGGGTPGGGTPDGGTPDGGTPDGGGPGGGEPGGGTPSGRESSVGAITSGGAELPGFPGILGFGGITTDQLSKSARFLTNLRRAGTPELISQNNLAEFTITYTSPPTNHPYNVIITDTVSGTGRIPGNQGGFIQFIPSSQTVSLPRCNPETVENCYTGRLDYSQGILIQQITPSTTVTITYRGNTSSSINCEVEGDSAQCLGEKFVNTARSESELGTREASAELMILCPYLLTRNAGDVLFEEAIDAGTDVSCIDPNVKNTDALVIKPLVMRGLGLPQSGIGDLLELFADARKKPALTPSALNVCDPSRNDVNSVIPRFSSFICEIETKIQKKWQRPEIEGNIDEHNARIARYNTALDDVQGVRMINDLNNLPKGPNPETRVFRRTQGDLLISSPLPQFEKNAQTIIVENGNLIIDSDIRYAPYKEVSFKKAPTLAFVVVNGDIIISPTVTHIDGVLVVKNGSIKSAGNISSAEQLEIRGAVFGNLEPLAQKRTYVGDPVADGGAIVIRYDARLLLNTPPGLEEFIDLTHAKAAR